MITCKIHIAIVFYRDGETYIHCASLSKKHAERMLDAWVDSLIDDYIHDNDLEDESPCLEDVFDYYDVNDVRVVSKDLDTEVKFE